MHFVIISSWDDPLIQFEEETNSFHFIFFRAVALNFFRGLEQMKPSFFLLGPLWLLILSSLFLSSGLASSWSPCLFDTLGPCPWPGLDSPWLSTFNLAVWYTESSSYHPQKDGFIPDSELAAFGRRNVFSLMWYSCKFFQLAWKLRYSDVPKGLPEGAASCSWALNKGRQ